MSYTAQLYIPFDASNLTEQVNAVIPSVTATPAIVEGVFSNAWLMNDKTKATYSSITSLFTSYGTIGFWLLPVNPGMVTNPNNGNTESLIMPLFSLCSFNTSVNPITASNIQFQVWEETQSDGKNVMRFRFGSSGSCVYTSTSYTTGVFHYFWLTINTSGSVSLYVDLAMDGGSLVGTPLITLPSGGVFELNNAVSGFSRYSIARNRGTIDDLVVFNTVRPNSDMISAIVNGAAVMASTAPTEEVDQSIVFDDSSTVQVNSVYSNRGSLYVARSDGELLVGQKTLWESRRLLGNEAEINGLKYFTTTGSSPTLTVAGMVLTNEIVQI